MQLHQDVARFLGAWRWLVAKDAVSIGEELALLFGIDPGVGRLGVKVSRFAQSIHADDQPGFFQVVERASNFGGDIGFSYRVLVEGEFRRIEVTGTCVRASQDGRPAEYLGAAHIHSAHAEHPLSIVADHLLASAEIAKEAGERDLSHFINMALMEAGSRIAQQERALHKPRPCIAVVR